MSLEFRDCYAGEILQQHKKLYKPKGLTIWYTVYSVFAVMDAQVLNEGNVDDVNIVGKKWLHLPIIVNIDHFDMFIYNRPRQRRCSFPSPQ